MGFTPQGRQRYRCYNTACDKVSFLADCKNKGYLPSIKKTIVDMLLNGSGVRDTGRVLGVSTWLVPKELENKRLSFKESQLA